MVFYLHWEKYRPVLFTNQTFNLSVKFAPTMTNITINLNHSSCKSDLQFNFQITKTLSMAYILVLLLKALWANQYKENYSMNWYKMYVLCLPIHQYIKMAVLLKVVLQYCPLKLVVKSCIGWSASNLISYPWC